MSTIIGWQLYFECLSSTSSTSIVFSLLELTGNPLSLGDSYNDVFESRPFGIINVTKLTVVHVARGRNDDSGFSGK